MLSVAVQWLVTLLLSVIGGLIARWIAPSIGRAAVLVWDVLREVRAYVLGIVFGLSLATGAFLADDVPWDVLVPVTNQLAVAAVVIWFAKNLLHLTRVNDVQLRLLERMTDTSMATDGGRARKRTDTGMIGGAIAGGYIGAGFGPHAAVFGAVVGASLGDELEKVSLESE